MICTAAKIRTSIPNDDCIIYFSTFGFLTVLTIFDSSRSYLKVDRGDGGGVIVSESSSLIILFVTVVNLDDKFASKCFPESICWFSRVVDV